MGEPKKNNPKRSKGKAKRNGLQWKEGYIRDSSLKKIAVPPKPDYAAYHRTYLDSVSIVEAERMIDDDKQRYQQAVQAWWNSLSPSQQKKAWKEDKQLTFYVTKPIQR